MASSSSPVENASPSTAVLILHASQIQLIQLIPKLDREEEVPIKEDETMAVAVVIPSTVEREEAQKIRDLVEESASLGYSKGEAISKNIYGQIHTEFMIQVEGVATWSWRDFAALLLGAGAVTIYLVYKGEKTTIDTKHVVTAMSLMAGTFALLNRKWLRGFTEMKDMAQALFSACNLFSKELAHDHDPLALMAHE